MQLLWGLLNASVVAMVLLPIAVLGQTPTAQAPAVPAIVAPKMDAPVVTAPLTPTTGTNLAQWIILGAALAGAFVKRMNDKDQQTVSWATLRDVLVVGGTTYATMDLAAELGFLQTYMAAVAKKPLTLGVVSFLVSLLAGAGVVRGFEVLLEQATGVLQKVGVTNKT